jgi:hypothetical protein
VFLGGREMELNKRAIETTVRDLRKDDPSMSATQALRMVRRQCPGLFER